MKFTEEQQAAIDLAATGESFSLIAPAGSGKSATALGMARQMPNRRILYLVYNTAARKEAEVKFKNLTHVDVRTTSQLARRAYIDLYGDRLDFNAPAAPARVVANRLKLKPIDFGGGLELDGYTQVWQALEAIKRFCYSDRPVITPGHVPLPVAGVEDAHLAVARKYLAKLAWKLWEDMTRPRSTLGLKIVLENTFKLLAESDRSYGYDTILLDEAQDSNDAVMKFLENQRGAQTVLIGDPAQALYGWRGASDQILRHKGPKLYLTQSFRFGEEVAAEARKHLAHTQTGVTIRGLPTIKDRVTDGDMPNPDVVLTRTNGGAMEYAMSYLMAGKKVALVKGTKGILDLAYAASKLMKGEKPNNLELSAFETWEDLVAYADEPGGGHLKSTVNLIHNYGVSRVIDACKQMTEYNSRNPRHDVAVTTCHSIKGLEWRRVQLGDDFFEPRPVENPTTKELAPGEINRHEAMIHYVAVTRAQEHLDRSGLAWIDNHPAPESSALV